MDETKKYYKEHGICTDCGQYDAAPGKLTCEVCAAKRAERELIRYQNMSAGEKEIYMKKHNRASKERYHRRKKLGQCVKCGKPQAKDSSRLCIFCREKERRRKRQEIQRYELPSFGICYLCCKKPVVEGKKLCADCYGKTLISLKKARDSENAEKGREYFRGLEYADFIKRTCGKGGN